MTTPKYCAMCDAAWAPAAEWVSVGDELPPNGSTCKVCRKVCTVGNRAETRATRPRHWFKNGVAWVCSRKCRAMDEAAVWTQEEDVWYCSAGHAAAGKFINERLRAACDEAKALGEPVCGQCAHCKGDVYEMLSSECRGLRFCSPRCAVLYDGVMPEAGVRDHFVSTAKEAIESGVFEQALSQDPERTALIESRLRESAPPPAPATSTQASSENQAHESNR
jgi:hypothetical protein